MYGGGSGGDAEAAGIILLILPEIRQPIDSIDRKEQFHMRLNIIGNGFDLYHGLPCDYHYFAFFLASHHPSFYTQMSEMFSFQHTVPTGYDDFEIAASKMFWKEFEEHLGQLDPTWLTYSLVDDLGLENDDPVDLPIPEAANSQIIVDRFCEWIRETVNADINFNIVNSHISKHKLRFRKDDIFVNFNYTNTLEKVYSIDDDRIFHIHGQCDPNTNWNDLVVGHGNDAAIAETKQHIREIKSDPYHWFSQSDRNRLAEQECRLSILQELRKDVPFLSRQMVWWLSSQKLEVETIRVWGLSISTVDTPYIIALKELFPHATWQFSFFTENEKADRKHFAKSHSIENPTYFSLRNDDSDIITDEIIAVHKIKTLPLIK